MAVPSTRHNPPVVHGQSVDVFRGPHDLDARSTQTMPNAVFTLSASSPQHIHRSYLSIIGPFPSLPSVLRPSPARTVRTPSLALVFPVPVSNRSSHLITSHPPRRLPLSLFFAHHDPLKLLSLIKPCVSRQPSSRAYASILKKNRSESQYYPFYLECSLSYNYAYAHALVFKYLHPIINSRVSHTPAVQQNHPLHETSLCPSFIILVGSRHLFPACVHVCGVGTSMGIKSTPPTAHPPTSSGVYGAEGMLRT